MKALKVIVYTASVVIFCICVYVFCLGTGITEMFAPRAAGDAPWAFKNDPFSWYFLAKGLFCSLSLYLSVTLIDAIHGLKAALVQNVVKPNQVNTSENGTTQQTPYHTVTATSSEKSWYKARQGVGH